MDTSAKTVDFFASPYSVIPEFPDLPSPSVLFPNTPDKDASDNRRGQLDGRTGTHSDIRTAFSDATSESTSGKTGLVESMPGFLGEKYGFACDKMEFSDVIPWLLTSPGFTPTCNTSTDSALLNSSNQSNHSGSTLPSSHQDPTSSLSDPKNQSGSITRVDSPPSGESSSQYGSMDDSGRATSPGSITSEDDNPSVIMTTSTPRPLKKKNPDYDPQSGVKPPFSYIALISKAIIASPHQKLLLCDIYDHIIAAHKYYTIHEDEKSWKNSIRHNLSLNECFIKDGRSDNGKGNFWAIHPACLEDFKKGDYRRRHARRRAKRQPVTQVANHYASAGYIPMTARSTTYGSTSARPGFHPYAPSRPSFYEYLRSSIPTSTPPPNVTCTQLGSSPRNTALSASNLYPLQTTMQASKQTYPQYDQFSYPYNPVTYFAESKDRVPSLEPHVPQPSYGLSTDLPQITSTNHPQAGSMKNALPINHQHLSKNLSHGMYSPYPGYHNQSTAAYGQTNQTVPWSSYSKAYAQGSATLQSSEHLGSTGSPQVHGYGSHGVTSSPRVYAYGQQGLLKGHSFAMSSRGPSSAFQAYNTDNSGYSNSGSLLTS